MTSAQLATQLRSTLFVAKHYARGCSPLFAFMFVVLAQNLVASSAFADASGTLGTVTGATTSIYATINAILRPLSLIAIIVCGLAGGFGKMEWGTVAKVAVGILIANSAVTIVDFMSSGTTAG